jgi:hypothetical protein
MKTESSMILSVKNCFTLIAALLSATLQAIAIASQQFDHILRTPGSRLVLKPIFVRAAQ